MIIALIFEKNFAEVKKKVALVSNLVRVIQVDIADGKFVDGETFQDSSKVGQLDTSAEIELHLMVKDPLSHLKSKINNVTRVCIHIELEEKAIQAVKRAKELGYQVGATVNPKTPLKNLEPFLSETDYVQFMTIRPGGQGRPFEKEVLKKIALFKAQYPEIPVQIDGAMSEKTIPLVIKAGADTIGIGSALVKAANVKEKYKEYESLIKSLK